MIRHFIELNKIPANELRQIIDTAKKWRLDHLKPSGNRILTNKIIALIFTSPSLRTRVSFEVAVRQLGGDTIMLSQQEVELGQREIIADFAKVLSGYVDGVVIRTPLRDNIDELAKYAHIPVINGLTQHSHPCQVMADVLTFEQHLGSIKDKNITWVGDNNNMLTSLIEAAKAFDFNLTAATPEPIAADLANAANSNARFNIVSNPQQAVQDADCVITDTWVSIGEQGKNLEQFYPYQVNQRLMALAKPEAIFMHCLPAYRGREVSDEVIDGSRSVVFAEAENRLHVQKAILGWCFDMLDEC